MAKYRYAGPGPDISPEGEITRPGDEREFAEEPVWGPWDLIDEPGDGTAPPPPAPVTPAPFTALPETAEGM